MKIRRYRYNFISYYQCNIFVCDKYKEKYLNIGNIFEIFLKLILNDNPLTSSI